MHPVLFKIGPFVIGSYGTALVVAVLTGIIIGRVRSRSFGIDPHCALEMGLVIMVAAIIGSRAWFVLLHLGEFRGNWWQAVTPVESGRLVMAGLAMNGGVLLVFPALMLYARVKKIHFLLLGDIIAPAFLAGEGIQRLGGCLLNGCCFGLPTDSILGVTFPAGCAAAAHFPGVPLWPTQIFASLLAFTGFGLILILDRRHSFQGYTLGLVFIYYPLSRFVVDQFRYYPPAQILGTFNSIRFVSDHILLAIIGGSSALLWTYAWLRSRQAAAAPDTGRHSSAPGRDR